MPDQGSGATSAPKSLVCEEYRRLLDEFGAAAKEVLRLHADQVSAIIQGDADCSRFDLLIHMANETKQDAKYRFIRHVQDHGCSDMNVTILS